LKVQSSEEAEKCTIQPVVKEDVDGCKSHFPDSPTWSTRFVLANKLSGVTAIPGMAIPA
jgi:hypothetical protein